MRWASPSARAVLPTPGSPTRQGLFFCRRQRISIIRSSSLSRQKTGSSSPSAARRVRVPAIFVAGAAAPGRAGRRPWLRRQGSAVPTSGGTPARPRSAAAPSRPASPPPCTPPSSIRRTADVPVRPGAAGRSGRRSGRSRWPGAARGPGPAGAAAGACPAGPRPAGGAPLFRDVFPARKRPAGPWSCCKMASSRWPVSARSAAVVAGQLHRPLQHPARLPRKALAPSCAETIENSHCLLHSRRMRRCSQHLQYSPRHGKKSVLSVKAHKQKRPPSV